MCEEYLPFIIDAPCATRIAIYLFIGSLVAFHVCLLAYSSTGKRTESFWSRIDYLYYGIAVLAVLGAVTELQAWIYNVRADARENELRDTYFWVYRNAKTELRDLKDLNERKMALKPNGWGSTISPYMDDALVWFGATRDVLSNPYDSYEWRDFRDEHREEYEQLKTLPYIHKEEKYPCPDSLSGEKYIKCEKFIVLRGLNHIEELTAERNEAYKKYEDVQLTDGAVIFKFLAPYLAVLALAIRITKVSANLLGHK